MFTTTGYYSPLPGQAHYVTGSLYSDKVLNGNGTNGASGAEVFPGMLAAPSIYSFGTKIFIPGIGISEVQDRGGAIVKAGEKGESYDRLDIWFGSGDAGLKRALLWGKRVVEATVFGVDENISISASFENWSDNEIELVKYFKSVAPSLNDYGTSMLFTSDLWFEQTSPKVVEMERILFDLGYLLSDPDEYYGKDTVEALFLFQRDNDIVYSKSELGAGHFGPSTRYALEKAKKDDDNGEYLNQSAIISEIAQFEDLKEEFSVFASELSFGKKSDDVFKLQNELIALGFLRIEPSGYYGDSTKNAVMRFQMKMGIIDDASDTGAGVVGPQTRLALNNIFDTRIVTKGAIAEARMSDTEQFSDFLLAEAK